VAITSTGYNGSVDDVALSAWQGVLGDEHGVEGENDWRVVPVTGKDRTVAVSFGAGFGWGVRDVITDAVVELQAPAPSGTALVVHTIAAKRDYAARTTTFVRFTNSAADGTDIAAAVEAQTVPGVVTYQGVATFAVRGGQTTVQSVTDHRRWTTKVRTAATLAGLGAPVLGRVGMLRGEPGWLWRPQLVGGTWTWVRQRAAVAGSAGPTYVGEITTALSPAVRRLANGQPNPDWRSFNFPSDQGVIGWVDVPDQGRAYRLLVDFAFVAGVAGASDDASPFWDFQVVAGSASAGPVVAAALGVGYYPYAAKPAQSRQLTRATPSPQVFTGAQRVFLVAYRRGGGSLAGEVAVVYDELRATPVYAD
jgi:hypothetical protein